jgi:hypothetical protein
MRGTRTGTDPSIIKGLSVPVVNDPDNVGVRVVVRVVRVIVSGDGQVDLGFALKCLP